jgi:vacuolar-type H+-ATPase subunit I/STV1
MFVAHASRTMANAKPKFRQEDPKIVFKSEVFERLQREHEDAVRRLNEENAIRRAKAEEEALAKTKAIMAEVQTEKAVLHARLQARRRRLEQELRELEADEADSRRYRHTVREIERRACKLFRMTREELRSRRRDARTVFAKHFVFYWACRLTRASLPEIGHRTGGYDHTTVLHGRERHPQRRAEMGRYLRPARPA